MKVKKVIWSQHGLTETSCLGDLTAFYTEPTGLLGEGREGDIVYLDFGEAFGTIYHGIPTDTLKYGLGKCMVRLMEILLNCHSERSCSTKYSWGL